MPEVRDTVTIEAIGARGDGVAETDAGRVYVPFALPGETWQRNATGDWQLASAPAADRATPACPHFTRCGGCIAQHMAPATYRAWKRAIAVDAFAHQGIAIDPPPPWQSPLGSRRRVTFTAVRHGDQVRLGYHALRSHDHVAIAACPIADERIISRLADLCELTALAAAQAKQQGELRVSVTAAHNGLDVVIEADGRRLGPADRAALARVAERAGILRLTVGTDEILQLSEPVIEVEGVAIPLPQGTFLQAVPEAEAYLAERVLAGIGGAKVVADLFAGLGTLTIPLARRARVSAFDSDSEAVVALERGVRGAKGLKPVGVRRRDLFREALSRTELKTFDAVVLDPPRAGADAQAKALARSDVRRIVAVSCNPATLARDVRTLTEAGYRLTAIDLIDQFLFSPHLEAVAVLVRGR